jgi:hypothetical protein
MKLQKYLLLAFSENAAKPFQPFLRRSSSELGAGLITGAFAPRNR